MAGEMAAVDSYGNMNIAGIGAQAFDAGYLSDFNGALNLGAPIIAAPFQIMFTHDMQPFGYVNVPIGWDVTSQGLPPGFSVSWDMATGISTIHGLDGSRVGAMVSPLQIFSTDVALVPIAKFDYDVFGYGNHVFARPKRNQLAAVQCIRGFGTGHPLVCPWHEIIGRNYGGPDGGASNF